MSDLGTTELPPITHATAHMHALHRSETSRLQRSMDRVMAVVGWPGTAGVISLAMLGWIVLNLIMPGWGMAALDPPPFYWLHILATTAALLLAALIFTTQRREDQLAGHRAQLIMELSILNDQKISKIIELIEEIRRDNPAIANRIDDLAELMSSPSDPEAVLIAIKDIQE
jgi:uncharacterized membrane protein